MPGEPTEPKTFSDFPELKEMAEELVESYYLHLGHINLDDVYFAEISGGPKPKNNKVGEVSGVSSAWLRQKQIAKSDALYCVAVHGESWDALEPAKREFLLFDMLYTIGPNGDGKLRPYDVKEHSVMTDTPGVGAHWRECADGVLPRLLQRSDNSLFPFSPPPLNQDDGSTTNL